MNRSLFLSIYALWGLAIAGGFSAWLLLGGHSTGRGGGSHRLLLLWSGWIALALFLVAALYAVRKYVHRSGLSPEFRMRATPEATERAEARMNELARLIAVGALSKKDEIEDRAEAILSEEGVAKVLRADILSRTGEEPPFEIRLRPTEPLGRVARWLHSHIYLGSAAAMLVFLHGGMDFSSPMSILLNGLSAIVIVTGIYGIVVWAYGPSWMTRAEHDLTIEEAFVLDHHLVRKVRELRGGQDYATRIKAIGEPDWAPSFMKAVRSRRRFPTKLSDKVRLTRTALVAEMAAASEAEDKDAQKEIKAKLAACSGLLDYVALTGQSARIHQTLVRLDRIKAWMSAWRILHVPASVLLLGLLVLHVFSIWWY